MRCAKAPTSVRCGVKNLNSATIYFQKGQKMTKFSLRLSQISLALVVFFTIGCGSDVKSEKLFSPDWVKAVDIDLPDNMKLNAFMLAFFDATSKQLSLGDRNYLLAKYIKDESKYISNTKMLVRSLLKHCVNPSDMSLFDKENYEKVTNSKMKDDFVYPLCSMTLFRNVYGNSGNPMRDILKITDTIKKSYAGNVDKFMDEVLDPSIEDELKGRFANGRAIIDNKPK